MREKEGVGCSSSFTDRNKENQHTSYCRAKQLRKVRYTVVAILGYNAHGSNKNPSCWVYLQGHFLTKSFDVGRHTLHPNFLRREYPP